MAKVSYVQLDSVPRELFFRGLKSGDRFVNSRIVKKELLMTRKRLKGLTQKTLLPQITELWYGLSSTERDDWSAAGAVMNTNGFRLFVRDTAYRLQHSISGLATPSLFHQYLVGNLHVESPASEIKIEQLHPRQYYVSRKISGTKGQYQQVLVTENFTLPLTISLNYKSDLSVVDDPNFAKFTATVWHSYQGNDLFSDVSISLDYSADWQYAEATFSAVIGQVIGYSLNLWVKGLRGDVFFDNIKAVHSGQNWLRDTYCQNIQQEFTKNFFQIPKHWDPVILPDGSEYKSIYPSDAGVSFCELESGSFILQESGFKLIL